MKDVGVGLALTVGVTGVLYLVWGPDAVMPGAVFGLLATVISVVAVALLRRGLRGTYAQTMARWAMGMGLRLVGVLLFVVAVTWRRDMFPPLPTAIGYLGVLIPLLFYEMRLLRNDTARHTDAG
jgi:drug/metabolite transporter (DMT)-like permease